jgi:hypothetical protein
MIGVSAAGPTDRQAASSSKGRAGQGRARSNATHVSHLPTLDRRARRRPARRAGDEAGEMGQGRRAKIEPLHLDGGGLIKGAMTGVLRATL